MIYSEGKRDDGQLFVLVGLTFDDIDELLAGGLVEVDLESAGVKKSVLLKTGGSDDAMWQELRRQGKVDIESCGVRFAGEGPRDN